MQQEGTSKLENITIQAAELQISLVWVKLALNSSSPAKGRCLRLPQTEGFSGRQFTKTKNRAPRKRRARSQQLYTNTMRRIKKTSLIRLTHGPVVTTFLRIGFKFQISSLSPQTLPNLDQLNRAVRHHFRRMALRLTQEERRTKGSSR